MPIRFAISAWILLLLFGSLMGREAPQIHDAEKDSSFAVALLDEAPDAKSSTEETTAVTAVAVPEFSRQDALIAGLTIFVLAVFLGFEVITKVPPTLHTPLMSGSNAISGITVVGALLAAGENPSLATYLGGLALVLATINAVGGFMVTGRMLSMFQRKT